MKINRKLLHNPRVGEILKEDFLEEIDMSQNALEKAIKNEKDIVYF